MTWEPGLGCINITLVILAGGHILNTVDKNSIAWGTPKVQANNDSKGLENPGTLRYTPVTAAK